MKFSLSILIVVAFAVASNAFNEARKQAYVQFIPCQTSYDCVDPCARVHQKPVDALCVQYPPQSGDLVCSCVPLYQGYQQYQQSYPLRRFD